MIKNIKMIVAVVIATVFLIPVATFAEPSVSDAGSSGSAVSSSGPSTSDAGNAGVTSSPSGPSTSDQGNSAVSSTPSGVSTSDQGNSAVSNSGNNTTPSTSDQGNSSNTSSGGSSNNNDSSGSRGGSRSRSGGGRSISSAVINSLPVVNTSDCPYISSYMKMGGNNDVTQVTKLQTFLKNNEKLNVDINGKFDQKTMDAVKSFQTKYANEVLLPWGGSKATGHVFYTTQKKINELVCNKVISLTPAQLKAIQDFKSEKKVEAVKTSTTTNIDTIKADSEGKVTPVIEVGVSSTTDDEQTASAVKASTGSKVWSFVKWLFGYKK